MIHVIAPTRREAMAWCRESAVGVAGMRWISRPELLWGVPEGAEVILVNRGRCLGAMEEALKAAYRLEKAGRMRLRVEFTK